MTKVCVTIVLPDNYPETFTWYTPSSEILELWIVKVLEESSKIIKLGRGIF